MVKREPRKALRIPLDSDETVKSLLEVRARPVQKIPAVTKLGAAMLRHVIRGGNPQFRGVQSEMADRLER